MRRKQACWLELNHTLFPIDISLEFALHLVEPKVAVLRVRRVAIQRNELGKRGRIFHQRGILFRKWDVIAPVYEELQRPRQNQYIDEYHAADQQRYGQWQV